MALSTRTKIEVEEEESQQQLQQPNHKKQRRIQQHQQQQHEELIGQQQQRYDGKNIQPNDNSKIVDHDPDDWEHYFYEHPQQKHEHPQGQFRCYHLPPLVVVSATKSSTRTTTSAP